MTALDVEGRPARDALLERHRPTAAPVLLSGVQAVARLLVEQHLRDARSGAATRAFVSGYPGSPLGGLDQTLAAIPELASEYGVHLVPGLNEELAATAVWGSQLEVPALRAGVDGVVGVWYGKSPGVDRAGDALRHGNALGAHPRGGVLVLVGDDPAAKSSTLPSGSERTLAALGMPVLVPRNAEHLVELGLYGVALSRASGHWVALKIVTDVADGLWSMSRDFSALPVTVPQVEWEGRPWAYQQRTRALPPENLLAEQELMGPRAAMLAAFAAANPLDAVEGDGEAWLGIVAAGTSFDDVRQALGDLGIDDPSRAGLRILRPGMITPLSPSGVRTFARGLDTVLVVEEKGPFVEAQVRDVLYDLAERPRVVGRRGVDGLALVPADGELTAARLRGPLHRVLAERLALQPLPTPRTALTVLPAGRTPYFCSGCPHNRSTAVPEGSLAGGGIGCHGMATIMPHLADSTLGLTQMGGEGAQWIGAAQFTDTPHLFQNMGDGTYFHSGQLAVQACVAAGVTITFKILYNAAVAMTGGQSPTGVLDVPTLTRKLHADGVQRIIVCADDPRKYRRRARFAPGVQVWGRERLDQAQRELRDTPGVTVLVYDQQCAAEVRRLRKRGTLPAATTRVVINERVCEGCGDCGRKSNCLSVQPVETEYGRKTQIDQASCNVDLTCLDGDCPAFMTVEVEPTGSTKPPHQEPSAVRQAEPPSVPAPAPWSGAATCDVVLVGIGGTGVVTVNQVLAAAAAHSGLSAHGLDQTGLSQKAGPVVSHLRLTTDAAPRANRVGPANADCYLAFDLLVGADQRTLATTDPGRTLAFVSTSIVPTGAMVQDAAKSYPDTVALLERVRSATRECVDFDALGAAAALLGETVSANLLLVGAACQAGALPLSPEAIEWAIEQNGVAVAANVAAFRWGRVAVADPDRFAAAWSPRPTATAPAHDLGDSPLAGATRNATALRASELVAHSGRSAARRYVEAVERAWRAEAQLGDAHDFSLAVARGLFHVAAYKDEYEVARLLTGPAGHAAAAAAVPGARRVRYRLHPPVLRALGLRRKVALGPAWTPALRLLARGRVLRGTWLDPFGHTGVRRAERRLLAEHTALVEHLTATLTAERYDTATELAGASELVRGYEAIKLANIDRYHARVAELSGRAT